MVQSLVRLRCPVIAMALGAALILLAARPALAEQAQTRERLGALALEMSRCSGFFALAATVLGRAVPEGREVVQRYDIGGRVLLAQAIAIAEMIELDADVTVAWSRAAM